MRSLSVAAIFLVGYVLSAVAQNSTPQLDSPTVLVVPNSQTSEARQPGRSDSAKSRKLVSGARQPGHANVEKFGSGARKSYHSGNPSPECPN